MARRRQQNPFSFGGFEFDDPEHARRLLTELGLGDVIPPADVDSDDDEDEEQEATSGPIPGFGERVRRPYATAAPNEETASNSQQSANSGGTPASTSGARQHARTPRTARPARNAPENNTSSMNGTGYSVRQDDPLLDAIIESSRLQIESMGAEIANWKAKVDARDDEISSLRDTNRRLQAEKNELEAQVAAVRKIVEPRAGKDRFKGEGGQTRRNPEVRQDVVTMLETQKQATNPHTNSSKTGEASNHSEQQKQAAKRGGYRYRGSRKPHANQQSNRQPTEHVRPRRPKTIFDLPKELVESVVEYLAPAANPKKRSDPVRETSKLFDIVWNQDLENWSKTCSRFSRILRSNYWWKVIKFDDEDPVAWHEKAEKISPKNRAYVRAIEFVRSEPDKSFEISTSSDDYDQYATLFPNLHAIRHHGQIKLIRILSNPSDWNYDHPLDVVDMLHTTSLVGDNDLKPGSKPAPLDTLILRDGTAVPSEMVYADLTPYRREKPNAVWLTYALRHFVGIENLVLHLRLKDESSAQVAEREKTPLRILRKEEWPALKTIEFRFAMPYAYGNRDMCMLNGFQELFKRFSPNIERVSFVVTLEDPKTTKGKVAYFRRQHRPTHLTYWGIVKNHYIPSVDRLEKFVIRLAKDLPKLKTFDFRVEDDKEDPAPLVRYKAGVEKRADTQPRVIHKEYKHRMPKGYPELPNFWEGYSPEVLWAMAN